MKKSEFFKKLQSVRGLAEIANRQTNSVSTTLYLMRLRMQPMRISLPKLKRKIAVEADEDVSQLIKIVIETD